jgi:hypothetical protein
MKSYKYKLDKSSKKYLCPQCGKQKLVRYVDSASGELQSCHFGRCDREDSCGYFLYPKSELKEYGQIVRSLAISTESRLPKQQEQVFIPWEALESTFVGHNQCSFFTYLIENGIPDSLLEKVIEMYLLGTIQSGHLRGALTIPYINVEDNIAFVQVKMFDELNKTIKTSALHSILKGNPGNDWVYEYEKNEHKVTCFFGAHLLKMYPNNPIVLVEAPKTAIYGACYYGAPKTEKDLLWLAVYNKSSLTAEKFKILEGRKILLIPDLSSDSGTFKKWEDKALKYAKNLKNTYVSVWDFLERNAPEELKKSGGDFADYLSQFSWQEFNQQNFGDESDKSGTGEKQISNNFQNIDIEEHFSSLLLPNTGYSKIEIFNICQEFNFFRNLNDSETITYLIDNDYIKQDFNRDNYYRFDSSPF